MEGKGAFETPVSIDQSTRSISRPSAALCKPLWPQTLLAVRSGFQRLGSENYTKRSSRFSRVPSASSDDVAGPARQMQAVHSPVAKAESAEDQFVGHWKLFYVHFIPMAFRKLDLLLLSGNINKFGSIYWNQQNRPCVGYYTCSYNFHQVPFSLRPLQQMY